MAKVALAIVRKYYPRVDKVVDSKKHVEIVVSPDDCKHSRRKYPNSCALARACERSYDGAIISLSVAYLVKGNIAHRFKVPERIGRELVSFDRNHNFAPGTYRLNAPAGHAKMGQRKYPRANKTGNPANGRKRRHFTTGIRSL